MKKLLLLLLLSLGFVSTSYAEICDESSKVQDRNGVLFLPNQTEPFSGNNLCSFDNGQFKSKGRYIGGLKSGLWTEWHDNGIKISEEAYTSGELESKTFFSDIHYQKIGKIFYKNGKETSKITWSYYPNLQMKFEQNTKNGKAHGKQTDWYENGQKMLEGNFINGKAEGTVTKWYENGNKEEERNLIGDKLNGKVTKWYENGKKHYEENYTNNSIDGKIITWWDNGQKMSESDYSDGIPIGKSFSWYPNGQIMFANALFVHGADGKLTSWYKNGQKKSELNYKDDKPDGKWTYWHENGQIRLEKNYKDGKLDGKLTYWYENGQIRLEKNYKDNHLDGKWTEWYENGQIIKESTFENGQIIKESKFKDGVCISGDCPVEEESTSIIIEDQLDTLKTAYVNNIAARVKSYWMYQGAEDDWGCDVYIQQSTEGVIEAVNVQNCTLDDSDKARSFRNSIERAVYKASPLPVAPDDAVFSREILFRFRVN